MATKKAAVKKAPRKVATKKTVKKAPAKKTVAAKTAPRKTAPKAATKTPPARKKVAAKTVATKKVAAKRKTVATKKAPAPPPAAPVTDSTHSNGSASHRLRVRMYRQGLGDCFLISIPNGEKTFNMVIDCGVVLGTENPGPIMTSVVEDIATVTGGEIDLLVATHEHWDHVSGFIQAKDVFDRKVKVKQVWLAWTENPKDALANQLRAERRQAEEALRLAVSRLTAFGAMEAAGRVDSLVGFFGATAGSTADALDKVKKMSQKGLRYCAPGEPPISMDGAPGVRFWILGPPKDKKLIHKSNPGKGQAYGLSDADLSLTGGEHSLLMAAMTRGLAAASTSLPTSVAAAGDESDGNPFESNFAIPMARAEQLPFFEQHYFGESSDESLYSRRSGSRRQRSNPGMDRGQPVRDQQWRRIDAAWLEGSETLALQLDSATNNTSLVIAMELVDTGEILLFPGDAQAGNWLSWQDLKWTVDQKTVTGPDLLARTTFYKVGHHGSHNATLKDKGLELMVNDALVAMIPVNHDMAVKKRWGRMPLPDLVDRLMKKTHGRVLRIDDAFSSHEELKNHRPAAADPAIWQEFCQRVTITPLYYELSF